MNTLADDLVTELRAIFQADGASLELQSATDSLVELRLIQVAEHCDMCVMDPESIENLVGDFLSARLGRRIEVTVHRN